MRQNVNVTENASFTSNLTVDGNITVKKDLEIRGISTLKDDVHAEAKVYVDGVLFAYSNLVVEDKAFFDDDVFFR